MTSICRFRQPGDAATHIATATVLGLLLILVNVSPSYPDNRVALVNRRPRLLRRWCFTRRIPPIPMVSVSSGRRSGGPKW